MKRFLSGVGALIFSVIFIAAGVFCTITGIKHIVKLKNGGFNETEATITKIESYEVSDSDASGGYRTEYNITVEFTVDGKKFVTLLNDTPKEFHEGMTLKVVYDKNDPNEVYLPGNTGSFIMIGLGIIGIIAGAGVLFRRIRGY